MRQVIKTILWIIWAISSLLLLISLVTDLEITDAIIKRLLVFIFLMGQIRMITSKYAWTWLKNLVVSAIAFALFMALNVYSDWRYEWETKTILFKNNHFANHTIEYQIQEKGPQQYNTRTVDRWRIFYFVSWTSKISEEALKQTDTLIWDRVDIPVK